MISHWCLWVCVPACVGLLQEKLKEEYGVALLDGHKQKVGNFRLEPPGLFRGRGEHPKMGVLKKRLQPEDININIGDISKAPVPPPGHKWKEVKSDNSVTWMASWTENVQGQCKYIMFNAESYLKGRNDLKKYETARALKKEIEKIRTDYTADLKNKVCWTCVCLGCVRVCGCARLRGLIRVDNRSWGDAGYAGPTTCDGAVLYRQTRAPCWWRKGHGGRG